MLLFGQSQPYIHFTASLPMGECLARLQKRDAPNSSIQTAFVIGEANPDHCSFQMRVQRVKKGLLDLTIYGVLNRQDYTTTQVVIAKQYTQHLTGIWLITAVSAVMGLIMALLTQSILMLALPIGVSIVVYLVERHNYQQVIQMIQETLDARTPDDKVKNDSSF